MAETVKFDNDFSTYKVVKGDPGYGEYAVVESLESGVLYVVAIDYSDYDSYSSRDATDFVDGFSSIDKAEALALAIKTLMDATSERDYGSLTNKEQTAFGIEYVTDTGTTRRLGMSRWFGWGTSYRNVAIVRSCRATHKQEGIEYR